MAKIVFVQRLMYEFPGTAMLSACLKRSGHETDVVIAEKPLPSDPIFQGATLIAFSVMTGSQGWAIATAHRLKQASEALVVFGGPHPTHCPEIINQEPVDIVCRGEGEEAIVELADRLDQGLPIADIANLWVKSAGNVTRNEVRPLIADLDALPMPDRDIYYNRYALLAQNTHKQFFAGRGCPYSCSFCSNQSLRRLYAGKGTFVRWRSPEQVLHEILHVQKKSRLAKVFFHDDTFALSHAWLEQFLALYEEQVGLPFYCQSRADTLTENLVKKMKTAGCHCVFFAIESGVDRHRQGILRKDLDETKITQCAQMLKKHGIKISTYNLIGIPGETLEDAFETIRLNIKVGADYPRCSFLTPYPGTDIAHAAGMKGLNYDQSAVDAHSQQFRLHLRMEDRWKYENVHALFQTAVLFPRTLPLIKRLVKIRLRPLYRLWWGMVYSVVLLRSEGRPISSVLPFFLLFFRQRSKA